MNSPLVSIIVPNYNYARYLKKRMDSIFSQTWTDYEIILLDDASTDDSINLLKEYSKDPKVSSLTVNEKNSGKPFSQWIKGISMAKGKYVWIAESDDYAAPEFLESCVNELETNPGAVIAFTGSTVVGLDGEPTRWDFDNWNNKKLKAREGHAICHNGRDYVIHNMLWKNYVYNASSTVFRRSAFTQDSVSLQCAGMRSSGDHLFWAMLMRKGDVIEIYRKLNFFRRHNLSQISAETVKGKSNGHLYDEHIDVIRTILDIFSPNAYRKAIIRGTQYKTISHSVLTKEYKKVALLYAKEKLGSNKLNYILERTNKLLSNVIPGLINNLKDRL